MTHLTGRFSEAVEYARAAHGDQVRKGSAIPYLYHLLAVSSLVLEYGGTEDQAIAGLLHDVLEDCGEEHEPQIREQFGEPVIAIVKDCTDGTAKSKAAATTPQEKKANWWARKLEYVRHLEEEPDTSLLVSGCDKLHNARAIIGDLENPAVGISVFDRFTGGREGTLRYYESIKRILVARQMPMALVFESIVTRMHELADASDRLPLSHGVYYLKVYDNFHYMDEDEVYWRGPFFSGDTALAEAMAIVDGSLGAAGGGQNSLDEYKRFGDDPMIVGSPAIDFSAWTYARHRCGVAE
ncbi:MAG: HD domain-containing protein [Proteobacteria bacterium]|nr:HD domain-containing protein [Pseudomonadota bacterium]